METDLADPFATLCAKGYAAAFAAESGREIENSRRAELVNITDQCRRICHTPLEHLMCSAMAVLLMQYGRDKRIASAAVAVAQCLLEERTGMTGDVVRTPLPRPPRRAASPPTCVPKAPDPPAEPDPDAREAGKSTWYGEGDLFS